MLFGPALIIRVWKKYIQLRVCKLLTHFDPCTRSSGQHSCAIVGLGFCQRPFGCPIPFVLLVGHSFKVVAQFIPEYMKCTNERLTNRGTSTDGNLFFFFFSSILSEALTAVDAGI